MTVEEFYIDYLSEVLPVHVSGDIPSPAPERFVTLEQTGSSSENHLYKPTLAVQSWAETRAEAAELNQFVISAMLNSIVAPEISSCKLDSDYNFPDLEQKRPRYQAIFQIVYLTKEENNGF